MENTNIEQKQNNTVPEQNTAPVVQGANDIKDMANKQNNATVVSSTTTGKLTEHAPKAACITEGMLVTGNIEVVGDIEVAGTVNGTVSSNRKVTVSGSVKGDVTAKEILFADAAIRGNVNCSQHLQIDQGTTVVGDVTAESAEIVGAVKGNLDVHGAVVLQKGALIVGDIKCESIQVVPGAIIKGSCDQCYADVDVDAVFSIVPF